MSTTGGSGERPAWQPQGGDGSHASGPVSEEKRKSSTLVKLGITAAVAGVGIAAIAALSDDDDEPSHAAVCVDQETNVRVDDDQCDDDRGGGHSHFGWFFFAYGHSAPRVGAPVTGGGSYTPPSGSSYVKGGVPRDGGVVTASSVKGGTKTTARGGFGSSSKGSGG